MKFQITPNGFDVYQDAALSTAVFPKAVWNSYLPLKLAGEAGEVAEKFGTSFRGDKPLDHDDMAKELGDVLWYVAVLAHYLGFELSEIAQRNTDKLFDRKDRGVLKGSGDNR